MPSALQMDCALLRLFLMIAFLIPTVFAHKFHTRRERHNRRTSSGSACSPGTYSSNGNTPCTPCPAGSYSKDSSAKSCAPARAGYYIPKEGATSETSCSAGTYNDNTGSTSCKTCPAGSMCPNDSLTKPQACSPGRYSTGGNVVQCTLCPAGYFNNIQGATGCCQCAAGWFNGNPGNTNCQMCSNQYPYSDPGAPSSGSCSATPGHWAKAGSCQQSSDGTCPGSQPMGSSVPRRALHAPLCKHFRQKACPLYSQGKTLTGYDCVDVENDLESCGGCVTHGQTSNDGGQDCSDIPWVNAVRCQKGRCLIESCQMGYVTSANGDSCIPV